MRSVQRIAVTGVILTMLLLLSITGYSSLFAVRKEGVRDSVFSVPEGVSLRWIAGSLRDRGFIRSSTLFITFGKFVLSEKEIMAGEYIFGPETNFFDILAAFKEGKVHYHRVTIPAGYNIHQIGQLLEADGLVDAMTFKGLTEDRELIGLLNTDAPSLEGFLYPDTYYFLKDGKPRTIVRKMVLRFKEAIGPDLEERASELGMTIKDIVTLASLIEKEAIVEGDRPLISAVFYNRLRKNMPLQSDPTVIYALGNGFDGDLKRGHLVFDSSYNTYVKRGLPPGPIASPGIESIRAALYPADEDYLYFVSKNDGTHYFSKNLKEHNKAVAVYQKPLALKKTSH